MGEINQWYLAFLTIWSGTPPKINFLKLGTVHVLCFVIENISAVGGKAETAWGGIPTYFTLGNESFHRYCSVNPTHIFVTVSLSRICCLFKGFGKSFLPLKKLFIRFVRALLKFEPSLKHVAKFYFRHNILVHCWPLEAVHL